MFLGRGRTNHVLLVLVNSQCTKECGSIDLSSRNYDKKAISLEETGLFTYIGIATSDTVNLGLPPGGS